MKLVHVAAAFALAAFSIVLTACGGSSENEEAAIRERNKQWLEAVVAKDAKKIAQDIYAEDGGMFPPNAPKAVGREAIEQAWTGLFQIPGVTLTFETEKFVFAKGGDLAVDIGTYRMTTGEGAAQVTDVGKGVVTWVKRDGKWQVLTDMFSSDSPPPAPPPPPPAPEAPAPADATPPSGTTPAPTTP